MPRRISSDDAGVIEAPKPPPPAPPPPPPAAAPPPPPPPPPPPAAAAPAPFIDPAIVAAMHQQPVSAPVSAPAPAAPKPAAPAPAAPAPAAPPSAAPSAAAANPSSYDPAQAGIAAARDGLDPAISAAMGNQKATSPGVQGPSQAMKPASRTGDEDTYGSGSETTVNVPPPPPPPPPPDQVAGNQQQGGQFPGMPPVAAPAPFVDPAIGTAMGQQPTPPLPAERRAEPSPPPPPTAHRPTPPDQIVGNDSGNLGGQFATPPPPPAPRPTPPDQIVGNSGGELGGQFSLPPTPPPLPPPDAVVGNSDGDLGGQFPGGIPAEPGAGTTGGSQPTPPGDTPPVDKTKTFAWQDDPLLAKAREQLLTALKKAHGATLKQKTDALVEFGDPELVAELLGADSPFVEAARQNQFSTVATLKHDYEKAVQVSEDDSNKQGLFYGGQRTNVILPELEHQRGGALSDESTTLQKALQALGIQDENLDTTYNNDVLTAEEGAFNRSLDEAIAFGDGAHTTPGPDGTRKSTKENTTGSDGTYKSGGKDKVKAKVAPTPTNFGHVRPDDRATGPMTGAVGSNGGRAVPVRSKKVNPGRYRGPH